MCNVQCYSVAVHVCEQASFQAPFKSPFNRLVMQSHLSDSPFSTAQREWLAQFVTTLSQGNPTGCIYVGEGLCLIIHSVSHLPIRVVVPSSPSPDRLTLFYIYVCSMFILFHFIVVCGLAAPCHPLKTTVPTICMGPLHHTTPPPHTPFARAAVPTIFKGPLSQLSFQTAWMPLPWPHAFGVEVVGLGVHWACSSPIITCG